MILNLLYKLYVKLKYGQFKKVGINISISYPTKIDNPFNISISDNVTVHHESWIAARPFPGKSSELIIGNNVVIGNFNHIYATHRIVIEDYVLTADKVYISDNLHCYQDPDLPILLQPIKQLKDVVIGEGSWLGENVCVIGANIGKHCVIGANAVVTKDIPDYSVAVGVPARIVKRYDFKKKEWRKTDSMGFFL